MVENAQKKLYNNEKIRNIGQFDLIENGKTKLFSAYEKIKTELKKMKPIHLFLSSYGFESPVIFKKFKKIIPEESLKEKKCLVIPYADKNPEKAYEETKQHLMNFGFDALNIDMVKDSSDLLLSFPDYIYVPLGDPFLLLKSIKDLNLSEHIIECVNEKRATYIGVSAGADITSKNIEYVTLLEDNNIIKDNDFFALGLIKEGVLCHYDHRSYSLLKACRQISGNEFLTLKDNQLIQIKDGNWEYIGDEI